ncbi:MAG TPA: ABC transporter permease [Longimicrobiales bacterium]
MDHFLRDIGYALRALARNPGFAAAAVLTLALGIGANTAIFSVVYGILLRPLPYPDAGRIHVVWNDNTREGIERDVTSFPNFSDWRARADAFEAMAGFTRSGFASVTDGGDPEQLRVTYVTEDFLSVFGVSPAIGRGFTADEMRPGADQTALLSDRLWQRRFGGDGGIVGRTIMLNGLPYVIAGVMPPSFAYPADSEIWLPLAPTELAEARSALWLSVIGRLRPGVEPALAQQQMDGVAEQLAEEYPGPNTGAGILLEPLRQTITGDVRTPLLVLLSAVAVVLLIGCANVANLLLARGAVRRRELAVRAALGAGRGRVARQLLTESVLLAVVGGAVGCMFAIWAVGAIVSLAPAEVPRLDAVRVDGAVLGFTLLVSVVTGLLFGLAPLLQLRGTDVMSALREEGRSIGSRTAVGRLRPILVSAEVGLALVLLVAAGLLIRSFAALNAVDPGFDPAAALTFRITVPVSRYETGDDVRRFHDALQQRLASLPGVRTVGATSTLFISRLPNMSSITREGDPPRPPDAPVESVVIESATPGFFEAMGMRVVQGRELRADDRQDGVPVAIVNTSFVQRYYPDTDPIGRRFTFGDPADTAAVWLEIAGVIEDTRRAGLAEDIRPESYRPHAQSPTRALTYVVRAQGDPLALVPAIRSTVGELDPQLPIAAVTTLEDSLAESLAARRFTMLLLAAFAALAATLAAIGIYGVVAYLVAQRTRELGVRMALGAHRTDVLRLVLVQSLVHVLPGIVLGTAAALALTRLLRSQLFGIPPHDLLTFAAVPLGVFTISMIATLLPARRASAVDPMIALRQE